MSVIFGTKQEVEAHFRGDRMRGVNHHARYLADSTDTQKKKHTSFAQEMITSINTDQEKKIPHHQLSEIKKRDIAEIKHNKSLRNKQGYKTISAIIRKYKSDVNFRMIYRVYPQEERTNLCLEILKEIDM